MHITIVL